VPAEAASHSSKTFLQRTVVVQHVEIWVEIQEYAELLATSQRRMMDAELAPLSGAQPEGRESALDPPPCSVIVFNTAAGNGTRVLLSPATGSSTKETAQDFCLNSFSCGVGGSG
jgi:hypothetical protein